MAHPKNPNKPLRLTTFIAPELKVQIKHLARDLEDAGTPVSEAEIVRRALAVGLSDVLKDLRGKVRAATKKRGAGAATTAQRGSEPRALSLVIVNESGIEENHRGILDSNQWPSASETEGRRARTSAPRLKLVAGAAPRATESATRPTLAPRSRARNEVRRRCGHAAGAA